MDQGSSEFFKYLKILHKRRYLCIAVSLVVMTGIIGASYFMPRQYKADSTVFIEENVIKSMVKGIAITPDMSDRIRVLKYALLSRDLISKALAEMDIDHATRSEQELQDLITDLQKRTSINVKGSDLFTVSIIDRDPRFAQGFTNRLIGRYLEENLSAKREETYGANRFLDEQLVHFKSKLDEAEDAIIAFRQNQGIYLSLDERSQLEDIKQYQREIENIALNLDTLLARKERLSEQLKAVDPTVAIFGESQQEDRIAGLEKRLAQLLLSYTENYPEVVRLKVEIEGIKRMAAAGPGAGRESLMTSANPVHQEVQQKSLEVEAEISALQARQKRLRSLVATREGELQNIPENRKQLAVLEQERDSYRKLYEELLARMGQSEVSKQMEIGDKTTNFRVVDPAVLPTLPVSPNMLKMILLAIAGGLGAGLGAAMLRENLDRSIKDLEHLQQLKVEVLAVIPRIDEPQTVARRRRLDFLAYGTASVYLFGVVCLLAYEALKRMV